MQELLGHLKVQGAEGTGGVPPHYSPVSVRSQLQEAFTVPVLGRRAIPLLLLFIESCQYSLREPNNSMCPN